MDILCDIKHHRMVKSSVDACILYPDEPAQSYDVAFTGVVTSVTFIKNYYIYF